MSAEDTTEATDAADADQDAAGQTTLDAFDAEHAPADAASDDADPADTYRDEAWLREQYAERERSQAEIAEQCGVHRSTVGEWLRRHGIETRGGDGGRQSTTAEADPSPVSCPTCSRVAADAQAARVHHASVHGVSLRGVAVEKWADYLDGKTVENVTGETAQDTALADRHPVYADAGGAADG